MSLFDGLGAVFVGVFGGDAEFTIQTSAGAKTVPGIFRENDQIVLPGEEFEGLVTAATTLRISRSDADGLADGDQATIGGVDFVLRSPMDDGRSMIVFRLEEV